MGEKRLCRCSPNCYKWLSECSIRRHYHDKDVGADAILPPLSRSEYTNVPIPEDDSEGVFDDTDSDSDADMEALDEGMLWRELGTPDGEMSYSVVESGDMSADLSVDASLEEGISMMSIVESDPSDNSDRVDRATAVGYKTDASEKGEQRIDVGHSFGSQQDLDIGADGDHDHGYGEDSVELEVEVGDADGSGSEPVDGFSDFEFDEMEDREDLMVSQEVLLEELERITGSSAAAEAELHQLRNKFITEKDRDNIHAFRLRLVKNLTREAIEEIRRSFSHKLQISSEYVMIHRIAILSEIEPLWYDMCVNSCIAYTTRYQHHTTCPLCHEKRRSTDGKARRLFCYIPLIPRLQGYYQNAAMSAKLSYRHKYKSDGIHINDVFDSKHYKNLLTCQVVVDGKTLPHQYFSDRRDIALAIGTDGFSITKRKRGGPSATAFVLVNYNIPPDERTHKEDIISLGCAGGPKAVKEMDTFLDPYDEELAELARGVATYDSVKGEMFDLHAYNIMEHGDIVATEKFMNMKGVNGFAPCRSCRITGVRDVLGRGKTYYVPLIQPPVNGKVLSWDPKDLPLRTHRNFERSLSKMDTASTKGEKEQISFDTGIKGCPALSRVGCMDFGMSFPWEFMHLLFENICPNLVDLWMGKFKDLNNLDVDNYIIPENTWTDIDAETVAAVKAIPSAFVRVLGNIASDRGSFKAESWAFWFMYLAPILLKDRLGDKYYHHMCNLVEFIKTCLKFSISHGEIDDLKEKIIKWVEQYEELYYQYKPERLKACTLTVHGLLHIPQNIQDTGPVWSSWTFYLERYCGDLQVGIHSKSKPWATLDKRMLYTAYLGQLHALYDLKDELSTVKKHVDELTTKETVYNEYPHSILRAPLVRTFQPDAQLRLKIAGYFQLVMQGYGCGKRCNEIEKKLPQVMPSWGKVHIAGGGDRIQAALASNKTPERDCSWVRYELQVENYNRSHGEPATVANIFYGQLQRIFVCQLPNESFWGAQLQGTTRLLALIKPCVTHGKDATKEVVYHQRMTTPIVTDLQTVGAVIGQAETRGRWGIIDRSGENAQPVFLEVDPLLEPILDSDSDV